MKSKYQVFSVVLLVLFLLQGLPSVSAADYAVDFKESFGIFGDVFTGIFSAFEELIQEDDFRVGFFAFALYLCLLGIVKQAMLYVPMFKGDGKNLNKNGKLVAFSMSTLMALGIYFSVKDNFAGAMESFGAIGGGILFFVVGMFIYNFIQGVSDKKNKRLAAGISLFIVGMGYFTLGFDELVLLASLFVSIGSILIVLGLIKLSGVSSKSYQKVVNGITRKTPEERAEKKTIKKKSKSIAKIKTKLTELSHHINIVYDYIRKYYNNHGNIINISREMNHYFDHIVQLEEFTRKLVDYFDKKQDAIGHSFYKDLHKKKEHHEITPDVINKFKFHLKDIDNAIKENTFLAVLTETSKELKSTKNLGNKEYIAFKDLVRSDRKHKRNLRRQIVKINNIVTELNVIAETTESAAIRTEIQKMDSELEYVSRLDTSAELDLKEMRVILNSLVDDFDKFEKNLDKDNSDVLKIKKIEKVIENIIDKLEHPDDVDKVIKELELLDKETKDFSKFADHLTENNSKIKKILEDSVSGISDLDGKMNHLKDLIDYGTRLVNKVMVEERDLDVVLTRHNDLLLKFHEITDEFKEVYTKKLKKSKNVIIAFEDVILAHQKWSYDFERLYNSMTGETDKKIILEFRNNTERDYYLFYNEIFTPWYIIFKLLSNVINTNANNLYNACGGNQVIQLDPKIGSSDLFPSVSKYITKLDGDFGTIKDALTASSQLYTIDAMGSIHVSTTLKSLIEYYKHFGEYLNNVKNKGIADRKFYELISYYSQASNASDNLKKCIINYDGK